jgi:DnaJ-class molecular chaperone
MTIPKGASSGRTLRLRGKGIPRKDGSGRGDQYVRLEIMLPEEPDQELEGLIEKWARTHSYDVRGKRGLAD